MNPLIQSKNTTILPVLIAVSLGCFGLSPQAGAVCQEGCLTNENTVLGDDALLNKTGSDNTAIGFNALFSNTTGIDNTATGRIALYSNTDGRGNVAYGNASLFGNTTGSFNTAIGFDALFSNNGLSNTAAGSSALFFNTTGSFNTATGVSALNHNTTGSNNTATGVSALFNNTTGSGNIALGFQAGSGLTTGNNNIYIGNPGLAARESRTIRIGNFQNHSRTFIVGIRDVTTGNADAIPVLIDSAGQLGTLSSARRFKNDIKPMEQSSEAILGLRPVTFHYKSDAKSTPQFGLIAEDVEKVNPALVARDAKGEIYTVRYEAVNAMLLNEFLKEHHTVQELKEEIADLTATVKAQAAQIQKVSDQLRAQAQTPRVVVND